MLRLIKGEAWEVCTFCGTRDKHTPECQDNWRKTILAYPTPEKI